MVKNDPIVIAKLLRAAAGGTAAKEGRKDVVYLAAADLLDPQRSDLIPMFYVKGNAVFQRPVRGKKGTTMGFCVCEVSAGVQPADVCAILNKGEPPENSENL